MAVEDDTHIRLAINYRLQKGRYAVSLCGDSLNAVEKARLEPSDLILLNLSSPRSNGFHLLERLQRGIDQGHPPMVVAPYDSGENRRWCLDLRARAFFAKPFSLRQVVTRLKERLA